MTKVAAPQALKKKQENNITKQWKNIIKYIKI